MSGERERRAIRELLDQAIYGCNPGWSIDRMMQELSVLSDSVNKIPQEAMGVNWPLTIYVCQQCARPSLFKEDRCCSGFYNEILVEPIGIAAEEWRIEELDLKVRAYNCLRRAGINTVGQLIDKTESWIVSIPNMGISSLENLKEEMAKHNLKFKEGI